MKKLSIAVLLVLCLFACRNKNTTTNENTPSNVPKIDTISYQLKTISKEYGNCNEENFQCAKAEITHVVFEKGLTPSVRSVINQAIINDLTGNAPSLEAALDTFIADYVAFKEEFSDAAGGYAWDNSQTVLYNSPKILAVADDTYVYTGGAHGNYGTTFLNFDAKTGKLLSLNDLLVADYAPKLKAIAEPIFRKKYLEPGMKNLSDAGFYFENDEFVLTDNFAITKEGIRLVYNPYEVAPYAMGIQQIDIPFSAINGLIKPGSVVAK